MASASAPHDKEAVQRIVREKIRRAAATLIAEEDVWGKYDIPAIAAERVVRHQYDPTTRQFTKEETIVKIEKKPFTHGAMRHCFRMKKLAAPPRSASNTRFHSYGWSRALNYVAKCYLRRGRIDTSRAASDAVLTDITLQYEAMHWAERFNKTDAPKKIDFIRAYAVEFVDRPRKPLFAVERFIAGHDGYGNGFLKHNTNSGFVDLEEHRRTPQIFSAFSFYASEGRRLVADIQGVGDLYTDPQVLSSDYRFGDGDLGPRGMALFFKTFRHCELSDRLGLPTFPLSRNEKQHQARYSDEESTLSDRSKASGASGCGFRRLDENRQRRKSVFVQPTDVHCDHSAATARRSNMGDISTIQTSMRQLKTSLPVIHRSKSDVDEISTSVSRGVALLCRSILVQKGYPWPYWTSSIFSRCSLPWVWSMQSSTFTGIRRASSNPVATPKRHPKKRAKKARTCAGLRAKGMRRGTALGQSMINVTALPMKMTGETQHNLGRVHYHLALLIGQDRFPEIVPTGGQNGEDAPSHDIFSVIFHLCHAASLYDVSACLALARARIGLDTFVSPLLQKNVPIDFESSKAYCRRAMASERSTAAPKIAAGCLLYQITEDEGSAGDVEKKYILEETLRFMTLLVEEDQLLKEHAETESRGKADGFQVGDKVEGNYFGEGTFYPGVVMEVCKGGNSVVVRYNDDGSSETLSNENVRSLEPPPKLAARTVHLSDEEALGTVNTDEQCLLFEKYDLMAKLAELKANAGERSEAAALFVTAAELAMTAGKMKTANAWSVRATELEG